MTFVATADSLDLPPARGMPAWILSLALHATGFIAIGLLAPVKAHAPHGEAERVVGIALVSRSANQTTYFSDAESSALSPAPVRSGKLPGPVGLPNLESVAVDTSLRLPTPGDGAAAVAGSLGLPNAGTMPGDGSRPGAGVGRGQTRTQVFGTQGTGNKFVYVFDRSSSMGGFEGRPLAAAKAELARSLSELGGVNQFQIVFYNERPAIFNPFKPQPPKLFFATDEHRQMAQEFIAGMPPVGGTRHKEALEFALGMSPDVLFFLTDAAEPGLSAAELAELRRRNRGDTMINAIEFGAGPSPGGSNFLARLAQQNGGQYVYIDVTAWPIKGP